MPEYDDACLYYAAQVIKNITNTEAQFGKKAFLKRKRVRKFCSETR